MHNYKNLRVWSEGIHLSTQIYQLTKSLPDFELFGLSSQIRRCSVSIPSNIAEGSSRHSDREFYRYLSIALGSSFELETQLIICKNLNYITQEQFDQLNHQIIAIQKMIYGLRQTLKGKGVKGFVFSILLLF